jgi:hypothetical protein
MNSEEAMMHIEHIEKPCLPEIIKEHGCSATMAEKILRPLPPWLHQPTLDYLAARIRVGLRGNERSLQDVPTYLNWLVRNIEELMATEVSVMNESTLRFPDIIAEHGCPKPMAMNIIQRLPRLPREGMTNDG